MHNTEFKQELLSYITDIPSLKRHSHKQFSLRCPFCGDSKKNPRDTHFYIIIDVDNDIPILYNCYRASCGVGGLVDQEVLRALDIYDLKLSGELSSYNKKMRKKFKDIKVSEASLDLKIPPIRREDPNSLIKKKYLEDRLGVELSFETLEMLKVVFRLGDFLNINKIGKITTTKEKAIELDEKYIGFVTAYDEKLIMRQVMESKLLRYENYTVDKAVMNTKKFYAIPTVVDLMNPNKIEINLTEGVLDILGVYFNVHNGGKLNSIYLAAGGYNFRTVIDHVIKMGITSNNVLNIYSDSEVDVNVYGYVYNNYSQWFDEINIFYNELSKDTGVPRDKIKLIKKKPKWVK